MRKHTKTPQEEAESAQGESKNAPQKRGRTKCAGKQMSFTEAAFRHAEALRGKRSESTIKNYLTALRSFKAFAESENAADSMALKARTVEDYDRWLAKKGILANSRSCYLRSLRALYHAVAAADERGDDPFCHVFTGNAATKKRAADAEAIKALSRLKFAEEEHELQMARDIFLFSTFAMGMAFVDAYHLKWSQVKDGVISYSRHKTGQPIKVKMEKCMSDIAEKYRRKDSDRVFPIHADYASALNKYNRQLHLLAKKGHVGHTLTSYVARHTWATMAYREHVDMSIISQGMGHANSATTDIYIKKTDEKQLWKANMRIIKALTTHTSAQEV